MAVGQCCGGGAWAAEYRAGWEEAVDMAADEVWGLVQYGGCPPQFTKSFRIIS